MNVSPVWRLTWFQVEKRLDGTWCLFPTGHEDSFSCSCMTRATGRGPANRSSLLHPPPQTSNFPLQTSHFKLQTSNFKLPPSNFKLQTSPFKLQTSNFKLQTSHFKLQTSENTPSSAGRRFAPRRARKRPPADRKASFWHPPGSGLGSRDDGAGPWSGSHGRRRPARSG